MPLSTNERKRLLPRGKQQEIADRLRVSAGIVSQVVNGVGLPLSKRGWGKYRRVQVAVARSLRVRLEDAFSATERGMRESAAA